MPPIDSSLEAQLQGLVHRANHESLTVSVILDSLGRRGEAILLILCSLPFCQPLQLPGFSTPLGLLVIFLGLRMVLGPRMWLPSLLLNRKISASLMGKISSITLAIERKLQFMLSKRLHWLVCTWPMPRVHGVAIVLLGIILAIPMPIPLSNILVAYPLLAFGLGILEDDGMIIAAAYVLSLLGLSCFVILIWLSKPLLESL